MKNKGKIYACIYIISILLFFIFAVYLTIRQTPRIVSPFEEPSTRATTVGETLEPTVTVLPSTPLINKPVLYSDLVHCEFNSIEHADMFISDIAAAIDSLIFECSIADKYTAEAITLMVEELDRLVAEQTLAERQRDYMLKWAEKEEEYCYATRTWKYLKSLGYSDVACAGIIGNLMAECGGNTLKLDPYVYEKATGKYYGMFQWSTYYYPEIKGGSFEEQLNYYAKTSIQAFKTYGKNYAKGFTLEDFNKLTDPREAALAFAKIYERCASWTYGRRQDFAEVAYQYFVLDFEEI
jgi:hypothetical protein